MIKKFINELDVRELNELFSFTNSTYIEKNLNHVSKAWVYGVAVFLNKKGYAILPKKEIAKLPNPFRSRIEDVIL